MVKLGIIAFANDGGLAVQTRRLCNFLKPYRVMVIDSSPFSRNKEHHFEWYKEYNHFIVKGFPKNHEIVRFVEGLTHVFVCENPYNFYLLKICKERGIKTYVQTNYEFCENLSAPHLPVPDLFLMPSYWMIADMENRFGRKNVRYLPPPIDPNEFLGTFEINVKRQPKKKRFLHVVGTLAFKDRNGTLDLINCLKYSKGDYELMITSQHPFPNDSYMVTDDRVHFEIGNKKTNAELYKNFDVLILPRRYGGLSLTTNEALMCGLPVLMPDITPNKELLPSTWLFPAKKFTQVASRVMIDVYASDLRKLAKKIDEFANKDLSVLKTMAHSLALSQFSTDMLKPQYDALWT